MRRTCPHPQLDGGNLRAGGQLSYHQRQSGPGTLQFLKSFSRSSSRTWKPPRRSRAGGRDQAVQERRHFSATPKDRPLPLSGAFMTTNPLLTDEELAVRKPRPVHPAAQFGRRLFAADQTRAATPSSSPRSRVATTRAQQGNPRRKFEVTAPRSSDAAERAWELCTALRRAKLAGL